MSSPRATSVAFPGRGWELAAAGVRVIATTPTPQRSKISLVHRSWGERESWPTRPGGRTITPQEPLETLINTFGKRHFVPLCSTRARRSNFQLPISKDMWAALGNGALPAITRNSSHLNGRYLGQLVAMPHVGRYVLVVSDIWPSFFFAFFDTTCWVI